MLVSLKIRACPGQCNNDWNYSTTPLVADTNQCWVLINYRWRVCEEINGDTVREVEITSIDKVTGGNCDNTSTEAIMMTAVKSILFHSSGIFMIQNPTIPYDITLNIPSCWRTSDNNNQSTLVACNSDLCCRTKVTMQTVDDWPQAVNQTPVNPPNPQNCSGIIGYICDYICNSIDVPLNEPLIPWHYDYSYLCFQGCSGSIYQGYLWFTYNTNTFGVAYVGYDNCNITPSCSLRRNNIAYQLQITHIQLIHRNATVGSTYEIIHQSNRRVLKDYCISKGQNEYYIRLFVRQCWKPIGALGEQDYLIYPCQIPDDCCFRDFRVFRQDNQWQVGMLETCPAVIFESDNWNTNSPCSIGCDWRHNFPFSYCDVLNDYYGGNLREGLRETLKPKELFFKVKEKFLRNDFVFEVESSGFETVTFNIYDMLGNVLVSKGLNLINGKSLVNIDFPIQHLCDGLYYFEVVHNADKLDNGLFFFIK